MIPGAGMSRISEEVVASAATIIVKKDLVRLSGAIQVDTILSPLLMGRDGVAFMMTPTAGNIVLSAAGNIAVGATLIQNRLYWLAFSTVAGKWYIHGVV